MVTRGYGAVQVGVAESPKGQGARAKGIGGVATGDAMSAKWLGIKKVKLDTIVLPKGFGARKKEKHVADLARSIEESGVIALPVVRDKPRKLVAGGDRLAALMLNGTKLHEVRIVSGTDEEIEAITLEENLWRRRGDDYDAMIRRLVELKRGAISNEPTELPATLASNDSEPEETRGVGRPKTPAGLARDEVARVTGRTPEAIRQAEKRAKAVEKEPAEPVNTLALPPVDTFDLELDQVVVKDWFPRVRVAQEVLGFAAKQIAGVLRRLTLDAKEGSEIVRAAYSRTYQSVHDAADAIRRAMPESVCPWCKCLLHKVPDCSGCSGTGFVALPVLDGISPELLERGAAAKVVDGRGGFELATKSRKPAKGARKLQVEPVADSEDLAF